MFYRSILITVLLAGPSAAQDVDYIEPKIPTEAEKIEALKLAYALNGNSMVGPTIDLTDPRVLEAIAAGLTVMAMFAAQAVGVKPVMDVLVALKRIHSEGELTSSNAAQLVSAVASSESSRFLLVCLASVFWAG